MTWPTHFLPDVAELSLGKMLDEQKNRGFALPYLANVNVRWGGFNLTELREMRFEEHEVDRFALKYGDIVMCEGGEPGRCAVWKEHDKSIMIQKALHRIRPRDHIDSQFLFYSLMHLGKSGHFSPLFTGATIKHLPKEKLEKVKIAVPTFSTQTRIADILSAYDDLIENNRRRIALLEQAARELYREWFVRLRFPGHEHAKIVDGLPEGWQWLPLGNLLTLQRGFDLPTQNRREGPYPIFASTGPTGYHETWKVRGPGVVTGRSGSLGKVTYVSGDFWPLNTTLWVKEFKRVSPEYAYHLLGTLQLEQYNGGAAVPTLNRNDVHRIEVLCPPDNLLREFNETASSVLGQIRTLEKQSDKLAEARDLLLPRLMNGSIAV